MLVAMFAEEWGQRLAAAREEQLRVRHVNIYLFYATCRMFLPRLCRRNRMTGKVATLVFGRRSAHWMLSGKCEIRNLRKRISRRADAVECNLYLELLERISLGRLGEFGYDQFMLAHYPKQKNQEP